MARGAETESHLTPKLGKAWHASRQALPSALTALLSRDHGVVPRRDPQGVRQPAGGS